MSMSYMTTNGDMTYAVWQSYCISENDEEIYQTSHITSSDFRFIIKDFKFVSIFDIFKGEKTVNKATLL